MNTSTVPATPQATTPEGRFALTIRAVAGTDTDIESSTRFTGRVIGKAPRKDLVLSQPIPAIDPAAISLLDATLLAAHLSDSWTAYIRRVKCQRLDLDKNSSITLPLPVDALEYAQLALKMLTAPAERAKKLVSASSVRAVLLHATYKAAKGLVIAADRRDTFRRIVELELLPLVTTQDAIVATDRAAIRDTAVIRLTEIASRMPEGNERTVLEAATEMLGDLATGTLSDAI